MSQMSRAFFFQIITNSNITTRVFHLLFSPLHQFKDQKLETQQSVTAAAAFTANHASSCRQCRSLTVVACVKSQDQVRLWFTRDIWRCIMSYDWLIDWLNCSYTRKHRSTIINETAMRSAALKITEWQNSASEVTNISYTMALYKFNYYYYY